MKKKHTPFKNLSKLIIEKFKSNLDGVVLECEGRPITGQQALSYILARYSQLKSENVSSGTPCAVVAQRGNYYWLDNISVWALGGVVVPIESVELPSIDHILSETKSLLIMGAFGKQFENVKEVDELNQIQLSKPHNSI